MDIGPGHPLQYVIKDARQWQDDQNAVRRLRDPHPRSDLARDDDAARPAVHVSVATAYPLSAAIDHLHAITALLVDADMHHPSAPFVLLRGSMEGAAQAYWVLHPSDRAERLRRAHRLALEDAKKRLDASMEIKTQADVWDSLDGAENDLQSHRQRVDAVITSAARWGLNLKPKANLSSTVVLRDVAAADPRHRWLPYMWMVCSAVAHGRPWSMGPAMAAELLSEPVRGTVLVRYTGNGEALTQAAVQAWALIHDTLRLLQIRKRAPEPGPAARRLVGL